MELALESPEANHLGGAPKSPPPAPLEFPGSGSKIKCAQFSLSWSGHYNDVPVEVAKALEQLTDGRQADLVQFELQVTNLASCLAQLYRNQSQGEDSCFQSHTALKRLLPAILSHKVSDPDTGAATKQQRADWSKACLNLVEYYLLVNDISHAENCLVAVGAVASPDETNPTCEFIDDSEKLRWFYYSATVTFRLLKSLQLAWDALTEEGAQSLDGVTIPLYLNPLYPPEEARNVPVGNEKAPAWCRAERITFDAPQLRSVPKPRDAIVPVHTLETLQNLDSKLDQHLAVMRSRFGVSLDTECEMFLESLRMRASTDDILFTFSDDVSYCLRRKTMLEDIPKMGLNPVGFRNVIQQALFDCGSSMQTAAEHSETTESKRGIYWESAKSFFLQFCENFRKELEQAKKNKQESDIFDPSDLPAFALGEMRLAYIYLKFGDAPNAQSRYDYVLQLFDAFPSALKNYPDLQEMKQQCLELRELIGKPDALTARAKVPKVRKATTQLKGIAPKRKH